MNITREQVAQLLHAINPDRVLRDNDGRSHVAQQDIRAHLTRIFGFGNWKKEFTGNGLRCIRDDRVTIPGKNNKPDRPNIPAVTYICELRLFVKGQGDSWEDAWDGDDVGTGTSPNLPDYGDAHDFAAKNAVSYALKRCATDLGDQFGLSLYNRGQLDALVRGTLVWPDGGVDATDRKSDVQEGVPQQVDLGDERPAEVDTSTGEVTRPASASQPVVVSEDLARLRGEINVVMRDRQWSFADLGRDYTRWAQGEGRKRKMLADADVDDLTDYKAHLASSKVHANGSVPA